MMKRVGVVFALVSLIIGVGTCLSFGAMGFRVYGGHSTLNLGEYNEYMQHQVDEWIDQSGPGAEIGGVNSLNSTIVSGWGVRFGKDRGLMFSLDFTWFGGRAGYSWQNSSRGEAVGRDDSISVMGSLASVLYAVDSGRSSFYLGGGVGYYKTSLRKTVPVERLPWGGDEFEYTVTASELGYHSVAGFRRFVSDNIALVVEVLYRVLEVPEMVVTESEVSSPVGETWWGPDLNLTGAVIMVGAEIQL